MNITKPKRIADPSGFKSARKKFCQICGRFQEYGLHSHHIKSKGSGGDDVPENEITVCFECHIKIHNGEIDLSVEEIITKEMPAVEEVLQIFVNSREKEENTKWEQSGALVILQFGLKMNVKQISSEVGLSQPLIRQMVKTYNTFPEESMRVPTLSFYHHRIAAVRTNDPHKWISLAADNEWSTRQMVEQIKLAKCESEDSKKTLKKEKAEKAFRLVNEVLAGEDEASEWLHEKLRLITGSFKAS